jgi:3-hydroxyisobutyrate dehydrogenase-like beta-hydroxyacid dehydrogenase
VIVSETRDTTVAVLGLGRMGTAIAHSVSRGGFRLKIWNRDPSRALSLAAQGIAVADTPREAATGASVVISSVLDDRAVNAVVEGPSGLLAGLEEGAVHVGTSTISPTLSRELAARHTQAGGSYVAAPVLGRPSSAEAALLTSFVAGDPSAVAASRRVVATYSETVVELGPDHGISNALKLAANYWTISIIDLMGQLFAFSEKSGIETQQMLEIIKMLLRRPALPRYAQAVAGREYTPPGFGLSAGLKDVELILTEAASVGAPLDFARLICEKFLKALDSDPDAQLDWSAITEVTRADAGLASLFTS